MKLRPIAAGAFALATITGMGMAGVTTASAASAPVKNIPTYQHIVEIMMENTSYGTIIGNSLAPNINTLANTYGLATDYFGVTHPSEPNYMANWAGDFFGVQDDNQFYCTPAMATTDPNCAGTTKLKFASLLCARSVASWVSGTMLASAVCVPVKFTNGLCLEA